MTNFFEANIINCIVNSKLKDGDRRKFIKLLGYLSSKTLSKIFAIITFSPKNINNLWFVFKNKSYFLKIIFKSTYLKKFQQNKLKKVILGMNKEKISSLKKNIAKNFTDHEKFKLSNEECSKKIDEIEKDLNSFLHATNKRLKKCLKIKMESTEKEALKKIRTSTG